MPKGPSSSALPFLVASEPNVRFTSVITTGDSIPGTNVFGGIPDGIGAFDNGNGTITVLVNHEYPAAFGLVRDHGSTGAYIDRLVINKATLAVVSGDDAIQTVHQWNAATDTYFTATTAFSRFCSGDLPTPGAFYDPTSGLGTQVRIYLTGEESGPEGRAFATVLTGAEAGHAYELPLLGNMSYENAVANPFAQTTTIVAVTDDNGTAPNKQQVYFYIGEKQATGTAIDQAGLTNGLLYGLKVEGVQAETNDAAIGGATGAAFTLQEINGATGVGDMTGAEIETESNAEGVSQFLRPEDAAWDPQNPNVLYFVTTNSFSGNSRLYQATFNDITDPLAGGTVVALLDGSEGQRMFDNITVADGKVILQEDPGSQPHLAKVWEYDIATDTLSQAAQFDPAKFTPGAPGFITQDEESSGVLDVTGLLGDADTRAYLLDAQIHAPNGDPATVEPGQLMVMYVDTPVLTGGNRADDLFGSAAAETLRGFNGGDSLRAGSGVDQLYGGNGNDRLDAGAGNDRLFGDNGDDRLSGGLGDDWLEGGRGDDVFYFDNLAEGVGDDRITDFARGDRLFLTQQLADPDANGVIELNAGTVDLTALDQLSLTNAKGSAVAALVYLGSTVEDGVTYYSYGTGDGGNPGGANFAFTSTNITYDAILGF